MNQNRNSYWPRLSSLSNIILFLIMAFSLASPQSAYAQGNTVGGAIWYVSTTGNDSNSCTTAGSPCLTINGAIGKAAASGDTIKVASGTYTGSGTEVVLINKSVTLSGGWNAGFVSQSGLSVIDGEFTRRGITVLASITAYAELFVIQNGDLFEGKNGIDNQGNLTLEKITIQHNGTVPSSGNISGINNDPSGVLALSNSAIINNGKGEGCFGGIFNQGIFTVTNSTISGNISNEIYCYGAALIGYGTVSLKNTTIVGNIGTTDIMGAFGAFTFENSIIGSCGNSTEDITSQGYNIISKNNCPITPASGDQFGTNNLPIDLLLHSLQDNGGSTYTHALLAGSPALNAGNPANPGSGGTACLATDQRGISRPVGSSCDIGAFEGYIAVATSINRLDPNPTAVSSVNYLVIFSEPVTGVDPSDFAVSASGTAGASVTSVSGSDDTYTVTVNTGSGNSNGSIRLNLIDDDSILNSSSTPLGGAGSSNGNFTTGEVYTLRRIPTTISPTNIIIDTTPTYKWTKITGATKYQYQLIKGSTVIYTKTVPASACSASPCVSAPTTVLDTGNYKWRVRAMIGGVWKNYSPYKPFVVSPAKPGFWSGQGVEFYVTNITPKVDNFAIYIYVNGCGSYKITHAPLAPIAYANKRFNFAGSFYANGAFITPTNAQGTLGLSSFYIPGCGYLTGGPFSWTATWKNGSQPDIVLNEGDIPEFILTPESITPFDLFTIDPEK